MKELINRDVLKLVSNLEKTIQIYNQPTLETLQIFNLFKVYENESSLEWYSVKEVLPVDNNLKYLQLENGLYTLGYRGIHDKDTLEFIDNDQFTIFYLEGTVLNWSHYQTEF